MPEPECAEYQVAVGSDPDDPGGSWIIGCAWPAEGLLVHMGWFPDVETAAEHYRRHGYEQGAADVPPFVDGPSRPVFSLTHGQTMDVAYCYDDLPVCMETSGTPTTVARTTDRFGALTSAQIQHVTEVLAE